MNTAADTIIKKYQEKLVEHEIAKHTNELHDIVHEAEAVLKDIYIFVTRHNLLQKYQALIQGVLISAKAYKFPGEAASVNPHTIKTVFEGYKTKIDEHLAAYVDEIKVLAATQTK